MRTTIDRAGRIVVPKALRDAMGLTAGREVDIIYTDGHLEIELPTAEVRLERRGKVMVMVPEEELPELSAEMVRETLEAIRR